MRIFARVLSSLLLLLSAACGDDGGAGADARASADAAADAGAGAADASPDATPPPMPVTVRAHDGATGLAGLQVAFLGPDDAVLAVTTTNGAGEASAVVPYGGQALLVSADRRTVYLWQGLAGGTLDLFVDTYDSMTVLVPPGPDNTGSYEVQTPCGGGGSGGASTSVPMSFLRRGCTSSDVVVLWRGSQPARAFHVSGQPLVAGTTLDLSAQTYRPHLTRGMVFTGVTSAPQTLIDLDLVMPGPVIVGGPADNVQAASGDVMIAGPVADLTGGLLRSTIGQLRGELTHQVTHLGPVTETTFAPGPHWLPDVGPATLDGPTREIRWTQGGTGQQPHGVEIFLSVDLPGVTPPVGTADVYWQIVSPGELPTGGGAARVRLPVLPPELATFDPASGTLANAASVTTYALPGGYTELRDRLFGRYGWLLLDSAGTMAKANNRGSL
ncbi:MAG: hypothetical protein KBG28_18685 [Kofleriaceae bacterium]|nr:hypothetical protein [Kofleriaceae bacterium]